ncbi:MAG: ABC transporter ATP-binding protein [Verrucomicrobia bacterium]|nr:ABC transporter ATP-binding protein [Verrucomicrobiota bacterium]MCH8526342.1 ABC transporter ATP-binding protein/permease [Kiritimatiellia bacterium]
MSSSRPFTPLEWSYQSSSPLRTLWRWTDCSPLRALWMLTVFVIKQSPAWGMPLVTAMVIDWLSGESGVTVRGMGFAVAAQMLLLCGNVPFHTYYVSQLSGLTRRLEGRLRQALVTRLQQLSIPYHDTVESGRLQAKVLRDVEQVQTVANQFGETGVMALSTLAAMVVITLARQPWMLLVYMIMVPMVLGLTHVFKNRIRRENQDFRQSLEMMNSEVSQMIDMIPVSRAHGIEEKATVRVESQIDRVHSSGRRLDKINALFQSSSWATFQFASLGMLFAGVFFARRGWITTGEVVLFMALFHQMMMNFTMMLNLYPQMAKGMESVRSIGEVLECPDLELNQGKDGVDGVRGDIEYRQVTYRYSPADDPALDAVNFAIRAGECVAVVGPSGGGKSTLLRLTIGFRRPTSGSVLLDGRDMESIDMRSWRRFISVVPQESVLFEGTIRENILFGMEDVDEARFEEILVAANVLEFVERLPEGLNTRVGEGGARLSGGQRQRLAIARALVRDPRVIVLDEPTSALDVMSEKLVQEAIERLVRGRTTLIVAHRLSTIRNADRVVVMEKGRIVESGTYDELAARADSAFRQMKDLQS